MRAFSRLYLELDASTKTNSKVEAMVGYFKNADERSSAWAVALLTGRRPKRPVKNSLVRAWALELADIPSWLFEECYAVAGDQAETISLLVPGGDISIPHPLHELMSQLSAVGQMDDDKKKKLAAGILETSAA